MELEFVTVDVFTSTPYHGNPLAIVKVPAALASRLSQAAKQRIASEFNLSETIFLHDRTPGKNEYIVDIFTDTTELPFAGHPTIGSAAYVLHLAPSPSTTPQFEHDCDSAFQSKWSSSTLLTKAGPIPIGRSGGNRVSASIPHAVHIHTSTIGSNPSTPSPSYFQQSGLSTDVAIAEAERTAPIVSIVKGMTFLLVRLPSLEALGKVEGRGQMIDFKGVLDRAWGETFVATYYYVLLPTRGKTRGVDERTVEIRSRMVGMFRPPRYAFHE